jgi:hypothetical protein
MRFPLAALTACMAALSLQAQRAAVGDQPSPVTTIRLELDDCDDIATDSSSF